MKKRVLSRLLLLAVATLESREWALASVGFQQAAVPDASDKPITVGIWYPSSAQPVVQALGMIHQTVAVDGNVYGAHLPLVLISHGTGGSLASHYDTAIALATAGFVVAAPTHTGDNYRDQSYAGNNEDLIERPRQTLLVLDWMLSDWDARDSLDSRRIGVFGFSLGGFTSLVVVGATPELGRMAQLCHERAQAPECTFVRQRHGDQLNAVLTDPAWPSDPRIKAAVVVAPAAAFLFGPGDLKRVVVPVQLWRAEKDQSAPDPWNSALVRQGLPRLPEEHVVPGADHFIFLAPCSDALAAAAPAICTDAPGFNRSSFHRDFNKSVVRFFARELPQH